jgi:hypothetical protein
VVSNRSRELGHSVCHFSCGGRGNSPRLSFFPVCVCVCVCSTGKEAQKATNKTKIQQFYQLFLWVSDSFSSLFFFFPVEMSKGRRKTHEKEQHKKIYLNQITKAQHWSNVRSKTTWRKARSKKQERAHTKKRWL